MSQVWRMPAAIAGVSLLGLASAILGDGLWDWLCWVGLSVPLLVVATKGASQLHRRWGISRKP